MYNKNVYSKYSNYTYICKSTKQRNALCKFLKKYGIETPKSLSWATESWKYLVISKKLNKVALYTKTAKKYIGKQVNLKTFVQAFGIITKYYTIYGELIKK